MKTNAIEMVRSPREAAIVRIEELYPHSPFHTAAYVAARKALGEIPVVFSRDDLGRASELVLGFIRGRRPWRTLDIPARTPIRDPRTFWEGAFRAARAAWVAEATIGSFGAYDGPLPTLPRLRARSTRLEHLLDLSAPLSLGSNHRRNVKRAREAGVRMVRRTEGDAVRTHVRLMDSSLDRRRDRGETVTASGVEAEIAALVATGAGSLFQAVLDGMTLSSLLVLESREAAYYHSSGSSAEGMQLGASTSLVADVADEMRARGKTTFNLGGATEELPGLLRFKRGFGSREVPTDAATVETSPLLRMKHAVKRALGRSDD